LPLHGFQKNQNYKLENERRYHDEPAGRDKVNENASKLDPDLLLDAPDANQGAPVVDHEGNVLGGNGRAMSIQKAYESFPERGEAYREALEENAARFGLNPEDAVIMKNPMLIRRLEGELSRAERQKLVSALNEDFTHSREKRSDSKSRGDRISERTLNALAEGFRDADSLRAYFDTQGSSRTVNMLVADGVIQNTEKAAYVGADGLLNPDGKTLVEAALRGRIANSYETLAKLPADIVGKLDAAIPHILIAEHIGGQWNITEHVREAVDMLAGFAKSGQKHADVYLRQMDMMVGKAPIETASKEARNIFNSALSMKKGEFTSAFAKYAKAAQISQGGLIAIDQQGKFAEAFGTKPPAVSVAKSAPEPKPAAKADSAPDGSLDKDQVRRANDASALGEMGDIVTRQHEKAVAQIEKMTLPDGEKAQALKRIKELADAQLAIQVDKPSPSAAGPARGVEAAKQGAEALAAKSAELDNYVAELQRKSDQAKAAERKSSLGEAAIEANKQGLTEFVFEGKRYVKRGKDYVRDAKPTAKPDDKGIALKLGETIGGSKADIAAKRGSQKEGRISGGEGWRGSIELEKTSDGGWVAFDKKTGKPLPSKSFFFANDKALEDGLARVAAIFYHKIVKHGYGQNAHFTIERPTGSGKIDVTGKSFASQSEAEHYLMQHAEEILNVEIAKKGKDVPTWRKRIAVMPGEDGKFGILDWIPERRLPMNGMRQRKKPRYWSLSPLSK